MRGSLILGALLSLAACLYVPYRYTGEELAVLKSTKESISRPITGVIYAPSWSTPTQVEIGTKRSAGVTESFPTIYDISVDTGRLLITFVAIAALTMVLVAGTRREAVATVETARAGAGEEASTEL